MMSFYKKERSSTYIYMLATRNSNRERNSAYHPKDFI